ncbi:hypothetical protein DITRI_Ditri15bG0027700 [Diplodiscus trichospermus]
MVQNKTAAQLYAAVSGSLMGEAIDRVVVVVVAVAKRIYIQIQIFLFFEHEYIGVHIAGNVPPPKPWEQSGAPSDRNTTINRNPVGRPLPTRPWEQSYGNSRCGGYGSTLNYNSGFNSGLYGSYGGLGGMYGGGMYSNGMYGGGYGGVYGSGMYGGGLYNSSCRGPMGGYGMGTSGSYGVQDPNNPSGAPPSPPGFWISVLRVVQGVVNFFGWISILIDQNMHASHMFINALLQLFDRSGLLYGELARFLLRLLGIRSRCRKLQPAGSKELPHPGHNIVDVNQKLIEGPKGAATSSWDQFWEDGTSK